MTNQQEATLMNSPRVRSIKTGKIFNNLSTVREDGQTLLKIGSPDDFRMVPAEKFEPVESEIVR